MEFPLTIPFWIAELYGDVDLLGLRCVDSLGCRGKMVVPGGKGKVYLGPQLRRSVRDRVPVLPDEAQVDHPPVQDLGVRCGVNLEDLTQELKGEPTDWDRARRGASECDLVILVLRHDVSSWAGGLSGVGKKREKVDDLVG